MTGAQRIDVRRVTARFAVRSGHHARREQRRLG